LTEKPGWWISTHWSEIFLQIKNDKLQFNFKHFRSFTKIYRNYELHQTTCNFYQILNYFSSGLKKTCVSGNPTLFTKIPFFSIGVFIIEVSILKKKRSRPYLKFLRPLPLTQYFFFLPHCIMPMLYLHKKANHKTCVFHVSYCIHV